MSLVPIGRRSLPCRHWVCSSTVTLPGIGRVSESSSPVIVLTAWYVVFWRRESGPSRFDSMRMWDYRTSRIKWRCCSLRTRRRGRLRDRCGYRKRRRFDSRSSRNWSVIACICFWRLGRREILMPPSAWHNTPTWQTTATICPCIAMSWMSCTLIITLPVTLGLIVIFIHGSIFSSSRCFIPGPCMNLS